MRLSIMSSITEINCYTTTSDIQNGEKINIQQSPNDMTNHF